MRLMVNNIAAFTLFFALALPTAADDIIEPPLKMLVRWEANEVPTNLSLYYDVDGDNQADIAFAHPIISTNTGVNCKARVKEDDFYWVFSTCPAEHAVDYFVFKQWELFKYVGGMWRRIYQFVDDYERTRTCSIREDEQMPWDQDSDPDAKSCSGN